MKIKDATFANAVKLQNKRTENFVTSVGTFFTLEFDVKTQLLTVLYKGSPVTKLIGLTNIVEMSVEEKSAE